jgi:tRNA-(ms[2]io[6]A)-hydroxylase
MTVATQARIGVDLSPLRAFLPVATPAAWVEAAAQPGNLAVLLVDHANCEKKAASTALNLMYRYVEHPALLHKLSRLAREELRHFEQVLAIIEARGIAYPQLSAARYASGLRELVARDEPLRLVDTLLVGAIIEARSCERFAALLGVVDDELSRFYASLLRSEARHFEDYLTLAKELVPNVDIDARLQPLLSREAQLVEGEDSEFRFHSGVPCTGPR